MRYDSRFLNIWPGLARRTVCYGSLLATLLCPWTLVAQEQQWWFEVEIILFQRQLAASDIDETFSPDFRLIDTSDTLDLITPYLHPDLTWLRDSLPYCFKPLPPLELENRIFEATPWLMQADETSDILERDPLTNDDEPDITPQLAAIDFTPVNVNIPASAACVFEAEQLQLASPLNPPAPEPIIEAVPEVIDGTNWQYAESPYLLDADSLQLKTLARDIERQRGLARLLHIGWRQNVMFGRDSAQSFRLFAGNNYADEFDANGLRLSQSPHSSSQEEQPLSDEPVQEPLMYRIRQALADDNFVLAKDPTRVKHSEQPKLSELWQLDGRFKVFLRYIRSVPYLHIDSELDYRLPAFSDQTSALMTEVNSDASLAIQPDKLNVYPFNQLRRIISTQVHYFDHPLFGMVVQVRRYHPPLRPEAEQKENAVNAGASK